MKEENDRLRRFEAAYAQYGTAVYRLPWSTWAGQRTPRT